MAKKQTTSPDMSSAPAKGAEKSTPSKPRRSASYSSVKAQAPSEPRKASSGHRRSKTQAPAEPRKLTITHDDIATLAFSYWERRGYQGGSPQDDWNRAEEELLSLLREK